MTQVFGAYWESKSKGDHFYCSISGGYLMVGNASSTTLETLGAKHVDLEGFKASPLKQLVQEKLGDKILAEIEQQIQYWKDDRHKLTPSPKDG